MFEEYNPGKSRFNTQEVAWAYDTTSETVGTWIRKGKLKATKQSGVWKIDAADLYAFDKSNGKRRKKRVLCFATRFLLGGEYVCYDARCAICDVSKALAHCRAVDTGKSKNSNA